MQGSVSILGLVKTSFVPGRNVKVIKTHFPCQSVSESSPGISLGKIKPAVLSTIDSSSFDNFEAIQTSKFHLREVFNMTMIFKPGRVDKLFAKYIVLRASFIQQVFPFFSSFFKPGKDEQVSSMKNSL